MPLTTEERAQLDSAFAEIRCRLTSLEEEHGLAGALTSRVQDVERDGRTAMAHIENLVTRSDLAQIVTAYELLRTQTVNEVTSLRSELQQESADRCRVSEAVNTLAEQLHQMASGHSSFREQLQHELQQMKNVMEQWKSVEASSLDQIALVVT